MPESFEQISKIIPSREIVDLSVYSGLMTSREWFRHQVEKLAKVQNLPLIFPHLPDFAAAKNKGLVTNQGYIETQLTLPKALYESDTYVENLELRGPMELIIYAYEREKKKWGIRTKKIEGKDWSRSFRVKMTKLPNAHIPESEPEPNQPKSKSTPPEKLKGIRIA